MGSLNLPESQQPGYQHYLYWQGTRLYPHPIGMLFADGEIIGNEYLDSISGKYFGTPFLTADQTIRTVPKLKFTTANSQFRGSSETQAQPPYEMRRLAYQKIVTPMGSIGGRYAQELAGMAYELASQFPTASDNEYAVLQDGNVQNQNPFISTYVPTMNVEEHMA